MFADDSESHLIPAKMHPDHQSNQYNQASQMTGLSAASPATNTMGRTQFQSMAATMTNHLQPP